MTKPDAYLVDLIPLGNTGDLWLTVDVPDESMGMNTIVIDKFKREQEAKAKKKLEKLKTKYNIIKNPYVRKVASTKSERKYIQKCKDEGKDFRIKLMEKFRM